MSEIELLNFRLNQFFNMFIVDDYGNLFAQRELVGKIQNLKLYIYPKTTTLHIFMFDLWFWCKF